MNPELEYHLVSGTRWTFEDDPPRKFAERHCNGKVLNPFAGETSLHTDCTVIRNDINENRPADYHLDAKDFIELFDYQTIGTIIHDPPWNAYQAGKLYSDHNPKNIAALKEEYHKVLEDEGKVIEFGYTTTCMPRRLQYRRENIALFQPYGRRKLFCGTVDVKCPRLIP